MDLKKIFVILICFAFVQSGHAQDERNKKESWYMYWGLGYPSIKYPRDLQDFMNTVEDLPGVDRTRVELDILGFYWPVNDHHTALGFVINGAGDRLTVDGDWVQINQYLYGISAMHFFDHTIGDGLFLRGDVGMAKFLLQDSDGNSSASEAGMGFLIGGGYAIPITSGTRLLFNINYSNRRAEGDNISKIGFSIGGLF